MSHPQSAAAWQYLSAPDRRCRRQQFIADAFLATDVDSGLRDELLDRFGVQPTRFEKVRGGLFSHLVAKPLYGKRTLMNRSVFPSETGFFLGGGAVRYSQSLRGAADAGIILRWHLEDWLSLRLTIRDVVTVGVGGGVDNVLHIDGGVAFNLGDEQKP